MITNNIFCDITHLFLSNQTPFFDITPPKLVPIIALPERALGGVSGGVGGLWGRVSGEGQSSQGAPDIGLEEGGERRGTGGQNTPRTTHKIQPGFHQCYSEASVKTLGRGPKTVKTSGSSMLGA